MVFSRFSVNKSTLTPPILIIILHNFAFFFQTLLYICLRLFCWVTWSYVCLSCLWVDCWIRRKTSVGFFVAVCLQVCHSNGSMSTWACLWLEMVNFLSFYYQLFWAFPETAVISLTWIVLQHFNNLISLPMTSVITVKKYCCSFEIYPLWLDLRFFWTLVSIVLYPLLYMHWAWYILDVIIHVYIIFIIQILHGPHLFSFLSCDSCSIHIRNSKCVYSLQCPYVSYNLIF
jgi:hypothetical protein